MTTSASPLISAEALRAKLGQVVLLDVTTGPDAPTAYETGHLPGAIFVDLDRELADKGADAAVGGRHPLPAAERFAAQVGRWGIAPGSEVVIYDAQSGGNAAARAWWMLRSLGHERSYVLDGGMAAARRAALPLTTDLPAPLDAGAYPSQTWHWPTVDIDTIERWRHDPSKVIVDARSPSRFVGDEEPFDPVAGHIPGARNLFHLSLVGADGIALPPDEIASRVRAVIGERDGGDVAVHCGSGVTACHLILAMQQAGLALPRLYVGSWSEWCRTDRPRAGKSARQDSA